MKEGKEWKLVCFVITSLTMPWPHECNKELRESVGEIREQLKEKRASGALLSALEVTESPSEGEMKGKQLCGLSVWRSVEDAERFVFSGKHGEKFSRRGEWCSRASYNCVLWWTEKGAPVDLQQGLKRLEKLRLRGPTSFAFSFAKRFPPPEDNTKDFIKLFLSLAFFISIIWYVFFIQN